MAKLPAKIQAEFESCCQELASIGTLLIKAGMAYNSSQGKRNQTGKVKMALRRLIRLDNAMRMEKANINLRLHFQITRCIIALQRVNHNKEQQ